MCCFGVMNIINKLETKAMPLLRQCNTDRSDRMRFPLPITITEKTSLPINVVQKIYVRRKSENPRFEI